eukprot:2650985-Prymnesium_polylepis.1
MHTRARDACASRLASPQERPLPARCRSTAACLPSIRLFEPVEPLSADLYAFIGRGRWRTGGPTAAWRR